MEFEEEEEEEHEEEEEEDMEIPTPPAPAYELPVTNSASGKPKVLVGPNNNNNNHPTTSSATTMMTRYRECLKNHALGMGGHAVDGCGEFLAAGEEGTLDALKCAACNCHRNFHRKEVNDHHHRSSSEVYHHYQQQFTPYYHHHHHRSPQPPHHSGYLHMTSTLSQHHQRPPLALPAASGGGGLDLEDMSNPSSSGGGGGGGGGGTSSGGGSKKRFRTKFSQEQKEKMLQFAESLGWRIQKHDEAAVDQFCADTGVRRQVLKVWMHNNKHTLELGKRYADENVREV